MAESLIVNASLSKEEKYKALLPQIEALISVESDTTANLANVTAALKESMNYFWVGFYIESGSDLVLGPFQGPVACTRIPYSKGVCGKSYREAQTILVPDVEQFPGHIACSSASKSEIVVPILKEGKVVAVLDVDSDRLNDFDEIDKIYLERLAEFLSPKL